MKMTDIVYPPFQVECSLNIIVQLPITSIGIMRFDR